MLRGATEEDHAHCAYSYECPDIQEYNIDEQCIHVATTFGAAQQ